MLKTRRVNFSPTTRSHRIELLAGVGLTAVLIGLHVMMLMHAGPLWRDEISSLTLATRSSWGEVWKTLIYDPCPLLFFLLLRCWHAIVGGSDFALRMLGFLIGMFAIAAFWIGGRLTARRVPLLALALLGFSPTLITWGDSLRAYGLAVGCIAIAFGCFWRVIEKPRPLIVCAATVAAVCSVQSLFTNALLIFACGTAAALVALRRAQWQRAVLVLAIGGVAGVSLVPYLSVLQTTQDWAAIRAYPLPLRAYTDVLRESLEQAGPATSWVWMILAVAAVGLAFRGQRARSGDPQESLRGDVALYGIIAATIGFVTTIAFFRVLSWPTSVWYYLPMLAVAALAIDASFELPSLLRKAPIIRVSLAIALVLLALPAVAAKVQVRASNLDIVADLLEKQSAPEDLVVLQPFTDGITFQRYFDGKARWVTIPILQDLTLHRWDQMMEQLRRPDAIRPVLDDVARTLQAGHRVWVISTYPIFAQPAVPPPVPPLKSGDSRRLGNFVSGWAAQLIHQLQTQAATMNGVTVPGDQTVSPYEQGQLVLFSGWKEGAPASSP